MISFRSLLLLFIAAPFVEVYFLIEIGSVIGVSWTIFLVVLTAAIGAWLVRMQGLAALGRVRRSLERGDLPAAELVEGVFVLLAGALLLTPGFCTDAVGFLFLTPPLRRRMARAVIERGIVHAAARYSTDRGAPPRRGGTTLEGEYRRIDD